MERQYTNELTQEMRENLAQPCFEKEDREKLDDEIQALIAEQEAYCRQHPVTAIYRLATSGCRTRLGGIGNEHNPENGKVLRCRLENGEWASVLTEGCLITYPDGSSAKIITSAASSHKIDNKGVALVGSLLDNGDEIISTPQAGISLLVREGVAMPPDFLSTDGGA